MGAVHGGRADPQWRHDLRGDGRAGASCRRRWPRRSSASGRGPTSGPATISAAGSEGRRPTDAGRRRGARRRGFAAARRLFEQHRRQGRWAAEAILAPKRVETCSLEQLRQTAEIAEEQSFPVCIHAAYSVHEFYDILREHQKTSIELLDQSGCSTWGPAEHRTRQLRRRASALAYSGGNDIEHGPARLPPSRTVRAIWCGGRDFSIPGPYRKAGVNVALGSDTYPRDMIMQMRTASYFAKVHRARPQRRERRPRYSTPRP